MQTWSVENRSRCNFVSWKVDREQTKGSSKNSTTLSSVRTSTIIPRFSKSVFFFSKGGKQLSSAILAENLTKLTATTPGPSNEIKILYDPSLLVGMQISH